MADYQKPIPCFARDRAFLGRVQRRQIAAAASKDTGKAYFPPRPFSPYTGSRDVEVFEASGKAKLFSYVINHRPPKGFEDEALSAIAVVELEEGPRMMTNITECEQTPEALELDMALEVVFEDISDEISLPKFRQELRGKSV